MSQTDVGLRINPEHAEGEVAKYDPCSPHSRLGFPVSQLKAEHLQGRIGPPFPYAVRTGFCAAQAHMGEPEAQNRALFSGN